MPDYNFLMYAIAVLLLLSVVAGVIFNVCRRKTSHRHTLAAAVLLQPSALLFALTHSYWSAGAVLGLAALYTGLGTGQYLASRPQPDVQSSQDAAPPQ